VSLSPRAVPSRSVLHDPRTARAVVDFTPPGEDGAVYTCGSGEYGRQGLGDEQPRRRLTRVPQAVFMGSRVVKVSCGGWHTMAVTVAGHAWTCGDNLHGQLGVGDTANRLGFTQVDAGQLGGARIVMAAC
jgi:alpha-tubulin suppressor-like RCC1 family protein